MLSAFLLLFGIMTIWLPPVRGALVMYPLGTISVLVLLALIFKFAQAGGTFGFMTGGVLALYVIAVIVGDTSQKPTNVTTAPPSVQAPVATQDARPPPAPAPSPSFARVAPQAAPPPPVAQPAPAPPEPRTLLAADGAILKFVAGVPYHLKVRTGRSTSLRANHGTVKLVSGEDGSGACVDSVDFPPESGTGPWREIEHTLRACGEDAVMTVNR